MLTHLTIANLANHSYWNYLHYGKEFLVQDLWEYRVIIFPGTQNIEDWMVNLNMSLLVTPYKEEGYTGKVKLHQGFYKEYCSLRQDILKVADTDKALIFGGHSKGGAIAQIAAVDVNYHTRSTVKLVTFGSPACGNKAAARSAQNRISHITAYRNTFDLVPFLLLWNAHASVPVLLRNFYFDPHHIKSYISNLKKQAY